MDHLIQIITVNGIAVGLAMDAFAVSIVSSATFKELHIRHALRMAFFFGAFQAAMPLLGYAAGMGFIEHIQPYDHWIAFALLAAIGGKMVYEGVKIPEVEKKLNDPTNLMILLVLSIATSIDALAVGLSIGILDIEIWYPSFLIGVITAGLSLVGIQLGQKLGKRFGKRMELIGGIILIIMGSRILVTHLFFQ